MGKKVYKYNTDWQIVRVAARSLKSAKQKAELVESFLKSKTTYNNFLRVYNWFDGLAIAYKKPGVFHIYEYLCEYRDKLVDLYRDSPETEEVNYNFHDYSEQQLVSLYKDLLGRAKVWLNKGYFNDDLMFYMFTLETYIDINFPDNKKIAQYKDKLQTYINHSRKVPNTYEFLY